MKNETNIDRFTFFRSYYEAINELSERDKKIILVAIVEYIFENKEPEFTGLKKSIWLLIQPHLNISKNKSANAKKQSTENQTKIRLKSNNNQNESTPLSEKKEEEIEERNKKREEGIESNRFTPSLIDIISYASDELKIDDKDYCEKFYNHYSGIGWVNGTGQEIIDWQSVFKNWVKRDKKKQSEQEETGYQVGSTKGLPRL